MFSGEHSYRVDAQGRIPLPARFRSQFPGAVVLTRGYDPCILVYPPDAWGEEAERIAQLTPTRSKNRQIWRVFFAGSFDLELDRQGRVRVPAPLRQYAGIQTEVVIAGMARFLEIWDRERWDAQRAVLDENLTRLAESLEEHR